MALSSDWISGSFWMDTNIVVDQDPGTPTSKWLMVMPQNMLIIGFEWF